jgi:hypothetical protein
MGFLNVQVAPLSVRGFRPALLKMSIYGSVSLYDKTPSELSVGRQIGRPSLPPDAT